MQIPWLSSIASALGMLTVALPLLAAAPPAAQADPAPDAKTGLRLSVLGRYPQGASEEGATEIVDYHPASKQAFVTNGAQNRVDVINLSNPKNPTLAFSIPLAAYGSDLTSVAVKNNLLAVAVLPAVPQDPGSIVFFDINGNHLRTITAGALPDNVVFSPNGNYLLAACEGEPDATDPEAAVTVVDLSGGDISTAPFHNLSFAHFNAGIDALKAAGVRIFPGKTVAEDVEPEYVAFAADGVTAFVSLQEANSIAVVDLSKPAILRIMPMGVKDYGLAKNSLDPSDRDSGINFGSYANLFGMYMPDTVASFTRNGHTYLVTANEGDTRDEDVRIKSITLDPTTYPNAATLQQDAVLGRLGVSSIDYGLTDASYTQLYSYGGRSFSIYEFALADAPQEYTNSTLTQVYDSGDNFERIVARDYPALFNVDESDPSTFDKRSCKKGPEPEALALGEIAGRVYAFIGLETVGGVMVYDVTDVANVQFLQYLNTTQDGGGTPIDVGPEGFKFVAAADSPTGRPMLLAANEVTGNITIYEIFRGSATPPLNVILGK